jgi:membrane protein implicated in regulation of membrane protease activity
MDIALVWVIAGILLILSELLATSIVAVFFGVAAVIVGLLLWGGVIESTEAQFFIFDALSLVLLFTARNRLRRYLVGDVADHGNVQKTFRESLGERATAVDDFA